MAGTHVIPIEGKVIELLANSVFRVELPNGHQILGHIPGKMRSEVNHILPGDKVMIEMSPYDLSKGRITFAQK